MWDQMEVQGSSLPGLPLRLTDRAAVDATASLSGGISAQGMSSNHHFLNGFDVRFSYDDWKRSEVMTEGGAFSSRLWRAEDLLLFWHLNLLGWLWMRMPACFREVVRRRDFVTAL